MTTREIIPYTTQEAWLKSRAADVTSTESAALFGMSPYVTRFDLWHRKKSGVSPVFDSNERMQWGNVLEAAIAAGVAMERQWHIRPMKEYIRLPAERAGASFDFEILNHPDGPAHLEIKNVDYLAFRDGWIVDGDDIEAPEHIEMQVQHQMLVSGYKRCFIGALIGGNRAVVIERKRDEPVIAAIRQKIAEFWQSVDNGVEPAPIMPEDADAVIRLNQFAEPGKILDASSDVKIAALVTQYRAETSARDTHKEAADVLKAELLLAIGDAEKVLLDGFTISASTVADSNGTLITPEMVGTYHGARRGYRNMRINRRKEAK